MVNNIELNVKAELLSGLFIFSDHSMLKNKLSPLKNLKLGQGSTFPGAQGPRGPE